MITRLMLKGSEPERAMKLISDAWKSADMRDKNIEDMKLDKLNKLDEITELKNKVSGLENEKRLTAQIMVLIWIHRNKRP